MCNGILYHKLQTKEFRISNIINHYYLYHQYQSYLPLHCNCLMKSLPLYRMGNILGIVLCYQDQMII